MISSKYSHFHFRQLIDRFLLLIEIPISLMRKSATFNQKMTMTNRLSVIKHKGIEILFLDYSNLKGAEYVKVIKETKEFLLSQPKDYSFPATISNSTGSKMDEEVKAALKDLDDALKQHRGENYQEDGASKGIITISYGITGLQKIIAGFIIKNVKFVNNHEEALAYVESCFLKKATI